MVTPSSFPRDPLGYAGNQAGHFAYIGINLGFFGALWLPRLVAIGLAFLVYVVLIEFVQIREGANLWDTLEDTAHVTSGAWLGTTLTLEQFGIVWVSLTAVILAGAVRAYQKGSLD